MQMTAIGLAALASAHAPAAAATLVTDRLATGMDACTIVLGGCSAFASALPIIAGVQQGVISTAALEYLPPIPPPTITEPATWSLLRVGSGLTGVALRVRQRASALLD